MGFFRGVVGTVLGDLIAQLSSHALASTPTEGGAAIAAEPLPRLGSGRGGKGGDEYTAGKDKDRLLSGRDEDGVMLRFRSFKYDVGRVLRLCLWSVAVGTPIAHYWFRFLDTRIYPHAPKSNSAVVAKLLLDQLVMSPAGTALFFFGFRLLEGGTLAEARSSLAAKWAPTMALNYVLWPAANIINFKLFAGWMGDPVHTATVMVPGLHQMLMWIMLGYWETEVNRPNGLAPYFCQFVPPEQRILYVNCVALFWSAVMSHMANRKEGPPGTVPGTAAASGGTSAAGSGGSGGAVSGLKPAASMRTRGHAAEPAGSGTLAVESAGAYPFRA
ncbi:hypothetical protein GPECTOR_2g1108 [Gonium pectorale]|uniref:Uncharacterized protein n=1 Tax=Gonium pectorale TaxID=33097 RepID=A0A150H0B3_GONPE|nr:hypothetical protein GPECTOR_2g1108 [Gonium pectorale]|eukprot:KXZ55559.1 hypothetical protein GPECTOR_2g1108 [Gonium pectorale]